MKFNLKNQEGFTLIETLIVLLISSILLLIPTLSMGRLIGELEANLFFRELTSNFTLMQNQAIMGGRSTKVTFYGMEGVDRINFEVTTNHPLNREMILESPYYRLGDKGTKSFRFKEGTGNITKSGSIHMFANNGYYKLTYLLGSGRFDIKEDFKK